MPFRPAAAQLNAEIVFRLPREASRLLAPDHVWEEAGPPRLAEAMHMRLRRQPPGAIWRGRFWGSSEAGEGPRPAGPDEQSVVGGADNTMGTQRLLYIHAAASGSAVAAYQYPGAALYCMDANRVRQSLQIIEVPQCRRKGARSVVGRAVGGGDPGLKRLRDGGLPGG